MLHKADPTKTKSWKQLSQHFEKVKDVHMKDLFADDPQRFNRFSIRFKDILLDYSKNRITEETLQLLLELADEIKSTSGMIAFAGQSNHREFIIGTETGILHPLSTANPGKFFIPADPDMICPDMKKTGMQDIHNALERMEPMVRVPEDIRIKAKSAVESMLAIPRS